MRVVLAIYDRSGEIWATTLMFIYLFLLFMVHRPYLINYKREKISTCYEKFFPNLFSSDIRDLYTAQSHCIRFKVQSKIGNNIIAYIGIRYTEQ